MDTDNDGYSEYESDMDEHFASVVKDLLEAPSSSSSSSSRSGSGSGSVVGIVGKDPDLDPDPERCRYEHDHLVLTDPACPACVRWLEDMKHHLLETTRAFTRSTDGLSESCVSDDFRIAYDHFVTHTCANRALVVPGQGRLTRDAALALASAQIEFVDRTFADGLVEPATDTEVVPAFICLEALVDAAWAVAEAAHSVEQVERAHNVYQTLRTTAQGAAFVVKMFQTRPKYTNVDEELVKEMIERVERCQSEATIAKESLRIIMLSRSAALSAVIKTLRQVHDLGLLDIGFDPLDLDLDPDGAGAGAGTEADRNSRDEDVVLSIFPRLGSILSLAYERHLYDALEK